MFIELNLIILWEIIITETFTGKKLKAYNLLLTTQTHQKQERF